MANNLNQISKLHNVLKNHQNKKIDSAKKEVNADEFSKILESRVEKEEKKDLKLSQHAAKRIAERNIDFNTEEVMKLKEAVNKLKGKGGRNSLIISNTGAYIVDVPGNKIVTAIDKENIGENVFTKIDSTMIVN